MNLKFFIIFFVFTLGFAGLVLAQTDGSASVPDSAEPTIDGSAPRAASEQIVAPTTKVSPVSTPFPSQSVNVSAEQTSISTITPQTKPIRSITPEPIPAQSATPFITASPSNSISPYVLEENSDDGSLFPMNIYGVIVVAVGVAVGGYVLLKSKTPNRNNKKTNDPCEKIKIQLGQKETELNSLLGGLSLKEIVLKELEKKLEDKKKEIVKELQNKAINEVLEFDESGKIKKTVNLARQIKKQYDDLANKYNKVKKAIEFLKQGRSRLEEEIKILKSSYGKCIASRGVVSSVIGQGGTLIETSSGNNKLYRYLTNGEGVWSAGKRLLPPELVEEANINRVWLKKPDLPEGNYRFWLTEAGKEKYEQTLYKIHQKYLSDIIIEEINKKSLGKIVYEDKFQVVEKDDKPVS